MQAGLRTAGNVVKTPDYVFYQNAAAQQAQKGHILTDALPQHGGLAVGDAKAWDRPLDKTLKGTGGDPFSNQNPSYQIAFYVQHSGVDWGILTNGRLWRLYHKDTAHKLDRFYEVNLVDLLATGDPQRFLYFYGFFCRAAFDPHPLGLAEALKRSLEYAREIGDTLKEQVYDALRHLAQGFLDYRQNSLPLDTATLKSIYDASLIVLYRLLFVLYAEARELLPVRTNAMYRELYSLEAIKHNVARRLDAGQALLPASATLWPTLKELFGIINDGSPPLTVATFNGGLFDPQKHGFIEEFTVGDAHLQQAIDKLARIGRQAVDYRDLAVRHLGTIYEGLLEFHLAPTETDEPGWTVALLNDRGERHATGSYYTPDFIVKYIVDQALRPALDKAVTGAKDDSARASAVLALNVLDPAMGSGHFLVEATEYIARYLVEQAIAVPGAAEARDDDLDYWKRRVVQSCIYGVDLNPLAVELTKLSLWIATVAKDRPLSFLDHHLRPGNSLIGARLSSLRPQATSRKRASRKTIRAVAAGQLSLLESEPFRQAMSLAVGSMFLIEESPGETAAQVKEQEQAYRDLRQTLIARFGRLADLVTATSFGLELDQDSGEWRALADYATGRALAPLRQFETWIKTSEDIAHGRGFFHWELEFPEVFFDQHGYSRGEAAGFDVVVGNPPYIRQELVTPLKAYLSAAYPDVFHSAADIYVYFISRSLELLAGVGGRMAFITRNAWLQANFARPLRTLVRAKSVVESLVDLGNNRTFAEAPDVCPMVFVLRSGHPSDDHRFPYVAFQRGEDPQLEFAALAEKSIQVRQGDQPDTGWHLAEQDGRDLFKKLGSGRRTLGSHADGQILMGLKTGLNEAFIIDQKMRDEMILRDPTCEPVLKPFCRGEDLRPWHLDEEGRWLILFPQHWTRDTFGTELDEPAAWDRLKERHPSIASHLAPFADSARARGDKGDFWWELRACDYYESFEKNRVAWPDVAKVPRFSFVVPGIYLANTSYFVAVEDKFILGYLQSRAAWFLISSMCLPNKFRAGLWEYRLFTQFMLRLPVPEANDVTRKLIASLSSGITEQSKKRYRLQVSVRHRIAADIGSAGAKLNQRLTAWWDLDFAGLRAEVTGVFKRDIPLKDRDEWEAWFGTQVAEHRRLTAEIVRLETDLNAQVYALFDLTPDEITLIERTTKYQYGDV